MIAFVAYVLVAFASCVGLAPMFMAGVAYAQGATLWGVYPLLAIVWYIMFSDWMSGLVSSDEEVD